MPDITISGTYNYTQNYFDYEYYRNKPHQDKTMQRLRYFNIQ